MSVSILILMARYQNINDQMASLNVEDEENEDLIFEGDIEEEVEKYELCLIGRFLTEKTINSRAMKSKIADVWKPAMGVNIKELETGIFLFQFFHKEDKAWVMNGGPWSFDNAMLLIEPIPAGVDPLKVPLWGLNIWIQIHNLPNAFMSEAVGRQLGNFFGEFVFYDPKNNSSIWRESMRLKIRLDVRKPLKRKKKIKRKNGSEFVVSCKYERLGDFCFSCGLVTHTERFCRRSLDARKEEGSQEWGPWLRAVNKRGAGQGDSKWLREDDDVGWKERVERDPNNPYFPGENDGVNDKSLSQLRDNRSNRGDNSKFVSVKNVSGGTSNGPEPIGLLQLTNGLAEEEDLGLDLDERKRKRTGPSSKSIMDTDDRMVSLGQGNNLQSLNEAVFSDGDYAASVKNDLAKLATQASQPL